MSTEAMRIEYARRKASGLCIACPKKNPKPRTADTLMCEEHLEYHRQKGLASWRARQPKTKICAMCPKEFKVMSDNKNQRFCSLPCSHEWQRNQRETPPKMTSALFAELMKGVLYPDYQGIEGIFAL